MGGGSVAGGYLYSRSQVPPPQPVATKASRSSSTTLGVSQNSSTGQLLGPSNQAGNGNSGNQQSKLPEPQDFEFYEQYKNSEGTLFQEVQVGTGDLAEIGDTVAMVYKGWLTNGQLFDQSRLNVQNQLEAFSFQLGGNQVITGWSQGIEGMKVGGKRRLVIPSQFAYGEAGREAIPPNAMLIFDVELVQVQKAPPQSQSPGFQPGL